MFNLAVRIFERIKQCFVVLFRLFVSMFFGQNPKVDPDWFKKDEPHGDLKRVIYKKYLQANVAKILKVKLNVQIIDGFAGKGRYGSEWKREIESYGSPLIIIMVVLQHICNNIDRNTNQRRGTTWEIFHGGAIGRINGQNTSENEENVRCIDCREIRIHFVEKKHKYFKALRRNINKYLEAFVASSLNFNISETDETDEPVIIKVVNPQFLITITLHRKQFRLFEFPLLANSRMLTIIDPYSYSDNPMQHVRGFLDQTSEVLITFMSSYIGIGKDNQNAVGKLFGIPTADINDFLARNNATQNPPKSYTTSYIAHMQKSTGVKYAQTFEVRRHIDTVIYYLIHFTNHEKALEAMKETFNTCTQYESEFTMSDHRVISGGKPILLGNAQNEEELANIIFQQFHGQSVDLGEVQNFVVTSWRLPFVFRKKALKRLEKGPNPRITAVVNQYRSTQKRRRGTYPSWGRWKLTFRDEACIYFCDIPSEQSHRYKKWNYVLVPVFCIVLFLALILPRLEI